MYIIYIISSANTIGVIPPLLKDFSKKVMFSQGLIIFDKYEEPAKKFIDELVNDGQHRFDGYSHASVFENVGCFEERLEIGVKAYRNLFVICAQEKTDQIVSLLNALIPAPLNVSLKVVKASLC